MTQTLRHWLEAEPFALCMSSGFFGFFAHTGALSALEQEGLTPMAVSGSSAGALVTGMWASGLSARDLERELMVLRREDFWDPAPGLGLLRGRLFGERLERLLPVKRFEDCRVPAGLSVFDPLTWRTEVLSSGPLAPAIQASCTLPFLFQPHWIGGRAWLDGGVLDRPGLLGLAPAQRTLYHHLASRSPWRRKASPALKIPARANMASVAIEGIPRLGPFRLHDGPRALAAAREGMLRALDAPVQLAPSVG